MVPTDAPLLLIVCLGAASDHEARRDALGRHLLPAESRRLRYALQAECGRPGRDVPGLRRREAETARRPWPCSP